MSDRYFVDTNIFVYAFEFPPSAKCQRAKDLIHQAITTQKGVISFQVAQEFINVALKQPQTSSTRIELEHYIAKILSPMMEVHSSQDLLNEALHIHRRYQLPWYDSIIVAAALEAQCEVLYSEDLQHGMKIRTMTIKNPFL